MSFIAGHYTATWNAVNIGTTRDGFRLIESLHAEMINTDDFGDVPVDGVQRGLEARLQLDYVDYDLVVPAIYAQTQGAAPLERDTNIKVGTLISATAKPLVLTAVAGTPAAALALGILTLTSNLAIIVSDLETIMASRLRQGPLTFHLLPYQVAPGSGPFLNYVLTQGA